jgi:membrane-associated protease RseP (regulator of RpoE activity)
MSVKVEDGWLTITAVHDYFPASRAGLRAGDRITRIDGQSTRNKGLDECLQQLSGAAGEKIVLTIARGSPEVQPFEVTLIRQSRSRPPAEPGEPVQWKGNKIVSRVLPYPDLNSFFIRLPIAHAAATGKGVKVAVLSLSEDKRVLSLLQEVAPRAEVVGRLCRSDDLDPSQIAVWLKQQSGRLAVIPDPPQWPPATLLALVKRLAAEKILAVVPSDLSEATDQIETINRLGALGALTVGRVDRGSTVMERDEAKRQPFNRRIREIATDVFSTVGTVPTGHALDPVATAGGVAALVLEKWPELSPAEVRERLLSGARHVWQGTSIESGQWLEPSVDPITTAYKPKDEQAIFRFRVLDAAGALGVDTDIPWFLNMLNCQKAWEITKGRGVVVVVSDQGFHLKHPELASHIQSTKHFGPVAFERPEQHFHGTDMSRILLAVAPEVRLVPVLCSGSSFEALATNITESFRYATELKAEVVSASWAGYFNTNAALVAAARDAVDHGAVLSWFHYPKVYPGLLRSRFVYWAWEGASLGFADRFLTDPPGFHPVEIEAGLSGTAPQAAGLAALIKSVNPKLTPRQVEDLMVRNATPIGAGVLIPDAHKAVLAALKKDRRE